MLPGGVPVIGGVGGKNCLRFANPAEANWRPEARKLEDLHLGGILGSLDWVLRGIFEDAWGILGRLGVVLKSLGACLGFFLELLSRILAARGAPKCPRENQ